MASLRGRHRRHARNGRKADRVDHAGRPASRDRILRRRVPASRARKIGAVKSLLSFAERTGLLAFSVGAARRVPPVKNILAERILEETNVVRLIALETDKRNPALLPLGHLAGLRISAICGRRWRDTKRRTGGGQITVFGKGEKMLRDNQRHIHE